LKTKQTYSVERWYNEEHRHSAIRFVTPAQRHANLDQDILLRRAALYQAAKQRNPLRWTGPARNWTPAGAVPLNPERDSVVEVASIDANKQPLAA